MVSLARNPQRPMIGWECSECGEPYNSRSEPDQIMCTACRSECIWELPDEHIEQMQSVLQDTAVGETLIVIPDHAASLVCDIVAIDYPYIMCDSGGSNRMIDARNCTLYRATQSDVANDLSGDDIHHIYKQ
jgi:DNA-directed RNA polymerase subunit RPC12/RpoP